MSIVRSTLAGLATGGRTFSGIGALVASVPRGTTEQPDATLAKPQAQVVIGLLATGELVADKLPFAPSRMEFPGVQGRVLFGAACGVIIARRSATVPPAEGEAIVAPAPDTPSATHVALCALAGAASAFAGSWLGAQFRGKADRNRVTRTAAAMLEDAAVLGLCAAAVAAPNPALTPA